MTQIFIVSGTSWTVPADWNSADNTVETIGGGGGGQTANTSYAGCGGGGGAYSKITNLSLTPASSVAIQVGAGGAAGSAGGDTWFNGATFAASSVGAKGGGVGTDGGAGGSGGSLSGGIGTTKYSGGNGGYASSSPNGAGAGGGAAGPNGNGANGGNHLSGTNINAGAGGGGNGGGAVGQDADAATIGQGGNGGNNSGGTGGGVGGTGAGGSGSNGGGGAGGYAVYPAATGSGGNGGNGTEWDASHGSGGGGGGGGTSSTGGNAGNYGGGGGGGGYLNGAGGSGAPGIIVVTYTPTASAAVTAESWSVLEVQETAGADQPAGIEAGLTVQCDSGPQTEAGRDISSSGAVCIEFPRVNPRALAVSTEWAGSIAVTGDALTGLEAGAQPSVDATAPLETATRAVRGIDGFSEWNATHAVQPWPAVEQLVTIPGDCVPPSEGEGPLAVEAKVGLEWTDPAGPLPVSSDRLLRPPARVRILATARSMHPLRGQ